MGSIYGAALDPWRCSDCFLGVKRLSLPLLKMIVVSFPNGSI